MRFSNWEQGTAEWLAERRGVITGSRVRDAIETLKDGKTPTAKARLYMLDLARERAGGAAPQAYVNAAMRFGTEQEPAARTAYEIERGELVSEVGFFATEDRRFGCSVDGLVGGDGIVEIKTLVSSDTLFKVLVDKDHSEYMHQMDMALWLLGRKWVDLVAWAPDLPKKLHVFRYERDDNRIDGMVEKLIAFDRGVEAEVRRLQAVIG